MTTYKACPSILAYKTCPSPPPPPQQRPPSPAQPLIRQAPLIFAKAHHQLLAMALITIYGHPISTHVRRVLTAAYEKGLTEQDIVLQPPFGLIPVMEDGQFMLYESRAIARYIAEKYEGQGTDLLGSNLEERALVEQWLQVEGQEFNKHISIIVRELGFKKAVGPPLFPEEVNDWLATDAQQKLEKVLDVYEKHLAKHEYLALDRFTMADLSHIPFTDYLFKLAKKGDLIESRPNVNAWLMPKRRRGSSTSTWRQFVVEALRIAKRAAGTTYLLIDLCNIESSLPRFCMSKSLTVTVAAPAKPRPDPPSPTTFARQQRAMAPITLYGHPISVHVRRVLTTAYEKGLTEQDIVLQPVDIFEMKHREGEFLEKQPFGLIPVMEDGQFMLYESRAIARYIAEKYEGQGTDLIGSNLEERALVEQWLQVEGQEFNKHVSIIVRELGFKKAVGPPLFPEEVNDWLATDAQQKLEKVLDVYEKHLAKHEYLALDRFTMADLSHLPFTNYLFKLAKKGDLIESRPNVNAWWKRISSRPSWKKADV
eukprot:SM000028S10129  [mRNA]  locus=s28:568582:574981:+ [translate_table: standard]